MWCSSFNIVVVYLRLRVTYGTCERDPVAPTRTKVSRKTSTLRALLSSRSLRQRHERLLQRCENPFDRASYTSCYSEPLKPLNWFYINISKLWEVKNVNINVEIWDSRRVSRASTMLYSKYQTYSQRYYSLKYPRWLEQVQINYIIEQLRRELKQGVCRHFVMDELLGYGDWFGPTCRPDASCV